MLWSTITGVYRCSTRNASPEAGEGAVGSETALPNNKNSKRIKAHKIIIFQANADNLAAGLVMQARRLGTPAILIDGKSHTDNVPVSVPAGSEITDEKTMVQD